MRRSLSANAFSLRFHTLFALLAIISIMVAVVWRYGGFDLMGTLTVGEVFIELPNTFAPVDHPFHATRAYLLLEDLKHWNIPRWIGSHQGGYPVEFYPFGQAWLDVALWALLFGAFPIIAVHKLAVLLILLLPVLGFWLLARGDQMTPWIAVLALSLHVVMPGQGEGDWMQGGSMELVTWGLTTNVGGAALALAALAALWRWVLKSERLMGVLAPLLIAAAGYTNLRSVFAICIGALAVLIVVGQQRLQTRNRLAEPVARFALGTALAGLLAAPIALPALRYNNLYYFFQYNEYKDVGAYWDASSNALTQPVLILAIAGALLGILMNVGLLHRAVALTYALYCGMTVLLMNVDLVDQLETPRLMPFQRLLQAYLAAAFVAWVFRRAGAFFKVPDQAGVPGIAIAILTATMMVAAWTPTGLALVNPEQQPFLSEPISTTLDPEFVSYNQAIELADQQAPDGTAILIVGVQNPQLGWWHEQMWAPTETNHPVFYNEWLWYWRTREDGIALKSFDGNSYAAPAQAVGSAYLDTHGIGAVVVTDSDARTAASQSPDLTLVGTIGEWDVFQTTTPTSMVTNGGTVPSAISVEDEKIVASFDDGSGQIIVRQSWFPRWEAAVNGKSVPIEKTENGYMKITVPPGPVTIEVTYGVTKLDWAARVAAILGGLGVMALPFAWERLPIGRRRDRDAAPQAS